MSDYPTSGLCSLGYPWKTMTPKSGIPPYHHHFPVTSPPFPDPTPPPRSSAEKAVPLTTQELLKKLPALYAEARKEQEDKIKRETPPHCVVTGYQLICTQKCIPGHRVCQKHFDQLEVCHQGAARIGRRESITRFHDTDSLTVFGMSSTTD